MTKRGRVAVVGFPPRRHAVPLDRPALTELGPDRIILSNLCNASRERHAMQKAVRKEKLKVIERPVSLRDVLEKLKAEGDLIESDKPINPDLELTGLQKHLDGGCPVLFNKVKGKPDHRVLTNLFSDIKVINKMFGWKDDAERVKKLAYALSHPLKPVEIPQDEAPCQ